MKLFNFCDCLGCNHFHFATQYTVLKVFLFNILLSRSLIADNRVHYDHDMFS